MKKELNVYEFAQEFKDMNRDYYSYKGYQTLFDYYNEFEDFDLDVVAICCEVSEYDQEEFINTYDYLVDKDDYYSNEGTNEEDKGELDEEEYLNALEEEVSDHTTLMKLENGSYLVWDF